MGPIVFLSYSHDSKEHRERVLGLSERLRADGIETRLDQYIDGTPEQGWPRWMLDQLDEASFVLVVCTETYYRRFRGHEEPDKGKGVDWEGALITQELYDARSRTTKFVPVLFADGSESHIPDPLRPHTHYRLVSEARYRDLYDFLLGQSGVEPREPGPLQRKPRATASPLTFADLPAQRIAPTRLPSTAPHLFGREDELARLEAAWANPATHVVTIVAWGGVGKTALVGGWAASLAARDYDGADYFDWSFYSQGTREQGGASGDAFLHAALQFFGDPELAASPAGPREKGARLAQLVAERRALLILDGLEPLQHPPGPLPGHVPGQLKDPDVLTLLKGLAQRNSGLCVVTTRESVTELARFHESTAPEWKLEHLSTPAGVELLKKLGVRGTAAELEQLVEDVSGHALTLNLLGRYLVKAHGGDVRRRDRVDLQKADLKTQGGHAFKTMAAYETWLAQGGEEGARQLAVLRLLGLFDRPASPGCLAALRQAPAIPGLTEPLLDLAEEDWNDSLSNLAECGLLEPPAPSPAPAGEGWGEGQPLDAHPLLREYFGQKLRSEKPEAWKAAHSRLFDYLCESTEYRPDTLEGLQPLYQAVAHGCWAGRWEEARAGVYRDRIQRGTDADGFYSRNMLGAFGADLGAIACFFEMQWTRVSAALGQEEQSWILNEAGTHLLALGRLMEALEPLEKVMAFYGATRRWQDAAIAAENLCELNSLLGNIVTARAHAEDGLAFAERSDSPLRQVLALTTLGDALHQLGERESAMRAFRAAERLQAALQPDKPLLHGLAGFQFCDVLLSPEERRAWTRTLQAFKASTSTKLEILEQRTTRTLQWVERRHWLLETALDHLTLGRAALYRAILEMASTSEARSELTQANSGLRRAGQVDELPKGLLTRAWLRAHEGDEAGARADLEEAEEIATRGPMPLYLADIALHRARLFRDKAALAEARRLIEKHGYWRRKEELEDAEAAAVGWG